MPRATPQANKEPASMKVVRSFGFLRLLGESARGSWVGLVFSVAVGVIVACIVLATINGRHLETIDKGVLLEKLTATKEWTPGGQKNGGQRVVVSAKSIEKIVLAEDDRSSAGYTVKAVARRQYTARIIPPTPEVTATASSANDDKQTATHLTAFQSDQPTIPPPAQAEGTEEAPSTRNYGDLLVINVTQYLREDDRQYFAAELYGYNCDLEEVRIDWWKTKAIADSANLVETNYWWGQVPLQADTKFPASVSSLASWIQEYWKSYAEDLNPDYGTNSHLKLSQQEIDTYLAEGIFSAMQEELGGIQKHSAITAMRWINGTIQFIMLTIFFSIMFMIACRWLVFVFLEWRTANSVKELANVKYDELAMRLKLHEATWGIRSSCLTMSADTTTAMKSDESFMEVLPFVQYLANTEVTRTSESAYAVNGLTPTLTGLGFLGTVIGIPKGILGFGDMLSDLLAKMQSGVNSIAVSLSYAFDTTFLGLMLSLIILFFTIPLFAFEKRIIRLHEKRLVDAIRTTHSR